MNFRRGMVRLFVVLTVLWVVPLGWLSWGKPFVSDKFEPMTEAEFAERYPECVGPTVSRFCEARAKLLAVGEAPRPSGVYWPDLILSLFVVLGPPAIAWGLLFTGFWIAAGFQRRD